MADDAISLHLTKAQTTFAGSTFNRLPRQDLDRPPPSRMDLVIHHMFEALIVGGVQEDLSL